MTLEEYEAKLTAINEQYIERGGKYQYEPGESPNTDLERWLSDKLLEAAREYLGEVEE